MGPQNLCDPAQAERFVKIVGAAGPKRPKDQRTKGPGELPEDSLTEGNKGNEVLVAAGFFIIRNKCVSLLCMG